MLRPKMKLVTVIPCLAVLGGMVTLVSYAPTLYRIFCAATGYGGTVQRSIAPQSAEAAAPGEAKEMTVFFDSNVDKDLNWEFRPEQHEVKVKVGQPTQVYYYAKNLSDKTVVARAVYNVTPYQLAPFFYKIQCFCFTSEKLKPGESARMPLVFFIDKDAAKDQSAAGFDEVTLSYTFYKQDGLSPEEVRTARDLGSASNQKTEALAEEGKADFDNDAIRR